MHFSRLIWVAALGASLTACSDAPGGRSIPPNDGTDSSGGDGAGDGSEGADGNDSDIPSRDGTGGDGTDGNVPSNCGEAGPDGDGDQDGFSINEGDCNDCSLQINPGAFDFPGDEYDQDCKDGPAAAGDTGCDSSLAISSTDPNDAARALGLCKFTTEDARDWGVVSARFTLADNTGSLTDPLQVGLLPALGAATPREGSTVLALSSGVARAPDQEGYTEECDTFGAPASVFDALACAISMDCEGQQTAPAGYPKASESCGGDVGGEDAPIFNGVALELKVRVPTNASSMSFESIFYSYEFPDYLCQNYNDFFVVLKEPLPELVDDGNILFDSNGDPIGVNTGLLQVCDPNEIPGNAPATISCSQGTDLLAGTGFASGEATCAQEGGTAESASGASTGWLKTTAPVGGGEIITLRFAIWDTGDAILDATALIDNFQWSVDETDVETTPVVL